MTKDECDARVRYSLIRSSVILSLVPFRRIRFRIRGRVYFGDAEPRTPQAGRTNAPQMSLMQGDRLAVVNRQGLKFLSFPTLTRSGQHASEHHVTNLVPGS